MPILATKAQEIEELLPNIFDTYSIRFDRRTDNNYNYAQIKVPRIEFSAFQGMKELSDKYQVAFSVKPFENMLIILLQPAKSS